MINKKFSYFIFFASPEGRGEHLQQKLASLIFNNIKQLESNIESLKSAPERDLHYYLKTILDQKKNIETELFSFIHYLLFISGILEDSDLKDFLAPINCMFYAAPITSLMEASREIILNFLNEKIAEDASQPFTEKDRENFIALHGYCLRSIACLFTEVLLSKLSGREKKVAELLKVPEGCAREKNQNLFEIQKLFPLHAKAIVSDLHQHSHTFSEKVLEREATLAQAYDIFFLGSSDEDHRAYINRLLDEHTKGITGTIQTKDTMEPQSWEDCRNGVKNFDVIKQYNWQEEGVDSLLTRCLSKLDTSWNRYLADYPRVQGLIREHNRSLLAIVNLLNQSVNGTFFSYHHALGVLSERESSEYAIAQQEFLQELRDAEKKEAEEIEMTSSAAAGPSAPFVAVSSLEIVETAPLPIQAASKRNLFKEWMRTSPLWIVVRNGQTLKTAPRSTLQYAQSICYLQNAFDIFSLMKRDPSSQVVYGTTYVSSLHTFLEQLATSFLEDHLFEEVRSGHVLSDRLRALRALDPSVALDADSVNRIGTYYCRYPHTRGGGDDLASRYLLELEIIKTRGDDFARVLLDAELLLRKTLEIAYQVMVAEGEVDSTEEIDIALELEECARVPLEIGDLVSVISRLDVIHAFVTRNRFNEATVLVEELKAFVAYITEHNLYKNMYGIALQHIMRLSEYIIYHILLPVAPKRDSIAKMFFDVSEKFKTPVRSLEIYKALQKYQSGKSLDYFLEIPKKVLIEALQVAQVSDGFSIVGLNFKSNEQLGIELQEALAEALDLIESVVSIF